MNNHLSHQFIEHKKTNLLKSDIELAVPVSRHERSKETQFWVHESDLIS